MLIATVFFISIYFTSLFYEKVAGDTWPVSALRAPNYKIILTRPIELMYTEIIIFLIK